jgi:hypothetical protein
MAQAQEVTLPPAAVSLVAAEQITAVLPHSQTVNGATHVFSIVHNQTNNHSSSLSAMSIRVLLGSLVNKLQA